MRLVFAFAVTLSFLAGQACGGGVPVFAPMPSEQEAAFMSKWIAQCHAEGEEMTASMNIDCGPGRCIENASDEPQDAQVVQVRMDALQHPASGMIAIHHPARSSGKSFLPDIPVSLRPLPDVRRE